MKAIITLIAVLFFLHFANPVFAAAQLTTHNVPLTIDQLQEFEVDINFSCAGCSDSYLRGVFYPSGNSYFGYTQDNSGNWSNSPGANCITYFKIAETDLTPEGSWSGKLKFKPDINNSYYSSPGEYLFKVGRYTPSCSSPSAWSQETTVAITGPTSTPTPSSTPIPTSTPNPTSTPTKTLTPTSKPNTPTPKISISLTKNPTSSEEVFPTSILGESTESGEIVSPTIASFNENKSIENKPKDTNNWFQKSFMLVGVVFIVSCAILAFREIRKRKLMQNE